MPNPILLTDTPQRLGYIAASAWLRTVIPPGAVGVYMLLRDQKPFYVGRSDACILNRLCNHERLLEANHVVWEPCASIERAFYLESAWFHILSAEGSIENIIHPARPAGHLVVCPFCDMKDMEAMTYVLPHLRKQNVVRPVFTDQSGGDRENQLDGENI